MVLDLAEKKEEADKVAREQRQAASQQPSSHVRSSLQAASQKPASSFITRSVLRYRGIPRLLTNLRLK